MRDVVLLCRCFSSIQNYGERYQSGTGGFETKAFFKALGDFFGIFMLSLIIGAVMGCITALISFLCSWNFSVIALLYSLTFDT